jgi:hypothetical protein
MTMASVNTIEAPVYRYFVVDLMSNEVLMEVPFQGVSYERALKNAGEFSGEIPVIEKTRHLGLYENTMPGQTGLYVVRNGVCVWGGIIWARDYNVKSQILNVSASEFTSYFHHRLIWKTLNFQYGCTITTSDVSSSTATTRQNVARNPVVGTNTNYWSLAPGSGTGATGTRVQGTDSTAPSYNSVTNISTLYRTTFGTSPAATGGVRYYESGFSSQYNGTQNNTVNVSVYFKLSSGSQAVRLRVTTVNSQGVEVGSPTFSSTRTGTTGWQQLSVLNFSLPLGGSSLVIDVVSSSAWTAGVSLDVTGLRINPNSGTTDIQFFSGDSTKSGDTTYGWQGTAHNSYSSAVTTVAATDSIPSITKVQVDNGTAKDIVVGASVRLDFYEPSDFRFNGFYKVISRDSPTDSQFTIESAVNRNIISVGRTVDNSSYTGAYNNVDFVTDGPHGLTNEDLITVSGLTGSDTQYNGTYKVRVTSDNESDTFSIALSLRDPANPGGTYLRRSREEQHPVSGVASRYLPAGVVYNNVTLTAKTDTYDYIRGLVNSVWEDFVGIKFADPYLTPGVTQDFDVTKTELSNGYATVTTLQPHGLSVGQAVTISQVDALFNGTWEVTDTPSDLSFRFALSGNSPATNRTITTTSVVARSLDNGVATVYVGGYYGGFSVGDVVTIDPAEDFDGFADVFTGTFVITGIPTPQSFTFDVSSTATLPLAYTQRGKIAGVDIAGYSLKNGILDITLSGPSTDYTVGKLVQPQLPYVVPVTEKSVDAANKTKSVATAAPHNLMVGDTVKIDGVKDSYSISQVMVRDQVATLTTNKPHVFVRGDAIDVINLQESYTEVKINSVTPTTAFGVPASLVNVTLDGGRHNLQVGAVGNNFQPVVRFDNYYSYFPVKSTSISNKIATVVSHQAHSFIASDIVTLSGITEDATIVSKEIQDGIVILTTSTAHNIQVSDEITVSGLGAPYDTTNGVSTVVLSTSSTRVLYQLQDANGNDLSSVNAAPSVARGVLSSKNSILNGSFTVLSVPDTNTVTLSITANNSDIKQYASSSSVSLGGLSLLCRAENAGRGIQYQGGVKSDAERTVDFMIFGVSKTLGAVPLSASRDTTVGAPVAGALSPITAWNTSSSATPRYTVSSFTRNTVSFTVPQNSFDIKEPIKDIGPTPESSGSIISSSVVNGDLTVTSVDSDTRITGAFTGTAPLANILESATNTSSTLRGGTWTSGAGIVTEIVSPTRIKVALNTNKTFGPNKNQYHTDIPYMVQPGGQIRKRPLVSANSFGPYPGNSNLGMTFSTSSYSGKNVTPTAYRGYALTSVGEALDEYSGTVDGFEYRVDCAYDPFSNSFSRTFVLIPIDFPNPPPAGQVSPPSRFGADKLVFEYPGNISDVQLKESAENSTTRFFAVGDSGLGGEAANPYSAASANELLNSENERKWPILDGKESVQDISDKDILSAYAQQYLKESRPPGADFTITLNGSLQPPVNTFLPGDWCSLIVRDDFVQERLASSLEPRDSVIVRKIDGIKVSVPDGITFPEVVNLSLIAEWDVDKKA